jgi:hypothetical protein
LNLEDSEYFRRTILASPIDADYDAATAIQPSRASNIRLKEASVQCERFFAEGMERVPADRRAEYLLRWVTYLQHRTTVIVVKVPDEVGAYRMFETLNDRGLKASPADILKNYLFSRSARGCRKRSRYGRSLLQKRNGSAATKNAALLTYIRHLWITKFGATRSASLPLKSAKRSPANAVR